MRKKLKKRPDGRWACRYKNQWFYSSISSDDALQQRDEYIRNEKRNITPYFVTEYAKLWLDRSYPDANPSTYAGVKKHLQHLSNAIGDLPVSEVKPSHVKDVYKQYAGFSNSYILAGKRVFCAVFDSAVADGLTLSNPARDRTAKPHRGTSGGHRSITQEEREWIMTKATDNRAYPVAMAMLYAGLRPQEAKALVIDRDVDFKADTITVRQTAHTDRNNRQKYALTDTGKTSKANRSIPLLPPLKTALEGRTGLLAQSAHGEQVTRTSWQWTWTQYKNQIEREVNGMQRRWYGKTKEHKAILAAGGKLPPWKEFTVTPYDLRHSFATMCRSAKPPIELHTVIKWMGHSDASMILQIYDSVEDDRDASEAQRLKDMTTDLTTI